MARSRPWQGGDAFCVSVWWAREEPSFAVQQKVLQWAVDRISESQLLLGAKEQNMSYVNVHGVNLYYEEYGEGPAVILTPGGRVDRNGLRPIAALLSPRCRVILHDRRNCGRSDVVILFALRHGADLEIGLPIPPYHHPQDQHACCRQPDPLELTAHNLHTSPGEKSPHANRRDLDRPPREEIPRVAEWRQQGDPPTAIGQHIEQGMREGGHE